MVILKIKAKCCIMIILRRKVRWADILSVSFCLTATLDGDIEGLISSLPFGISEQERLCSMKNDSARRSSLASLLALRSLLPESCDDLTILRTQNRKPYFGSHPLHFSLSHIDGISVCAISDTPVGIDIEWLDRERNFLDVSRRFFSLDEQKLIEESLTPSFDFYSLWTKKEALAKLTGEGLISVCSAKSHDEGYYTQYILEHEGRRAILSICSANPENTPVLYPQSGLNIKGEI